MSKITKLKNGIEISKAIISDIMFLYQFRITKTDFTRMGKSKMKFNSIILFILNFVKKSLQLELDDFFKKIQKGNESISKQGFSQARQKVSPKAFVYLLDKVNNWFYSETNFKKYRGYRLLAIDGTVIELHNSEELRNTYGYIKNQNALVARARAATLYDVENDMIIASKIDNYKSSERTMAEELISDMCNIGKYNDLILFDRGYPSRDLINFIEERDVKYLMRVSSRFLFEVVNTRYSDEIIQVKYKGKIIKMRVIKLTLDSGEIETLITNIYDDNFTIGDFKNLYFKRWGIEIKYNEIKNKLQIENFSGKTPIAIEQDFYATMYLANMVSLAKQDANEKIDEHYKERNLKYEYKVNTNILIGKLKDKLILMISSNNPWKRSRILNE